MLKITKMEDSGAAVILKLEGKVTDQWADLLAEECQSLLGNRKTLLLDCTDVHFLDERGVEVLRNLPPQHVTIVDAPGIVTELFKTGGRS